MSAIVDSLTQAYGIAVIRGITTTESLWLSPLRTCSTASDRAHTPGVRGFVANPAAMVQPWVSKDIASPVADIPASYHNSMNLVAAAAHVSAVFRQPLK